MNRTRSLWESRVVTDLAHGLNVLVVAHGNSLRGLVKLIDNISDEDIEQVGEACSSLEAKTRHERASAARRRPLVPSACTCALVRARVLGGHPDRHSAHLQV
jgi:broad specificity phosphatase PhoE